MTLFWSQETEKIARLRLRETLNKLKKGLPDESLLVSQKDLIGLDFGKIYVDLLAFQQITSQVGQLPWKISPDEPLPNTIANLLNRASQLWRSQKVLAGANFSSSQLLDTWFSNLANYHERLYTRILERLADHETATGNLETALNLARQTVQGHELEEELHARVLRLLIQMGSIKEARAYYKEVEAIIIRETNSLPGRELVELYQQIRGDTHPVPPAKIHWNIHSSVQVPFVGRRKQLLQLHRAYQRGGGCFILGESGQGKTRLLQEFYSQLQKAPRLLLVRCRPTESNLPFQPLVDVLRQNTLPKEWLNLPRSWATHLRVLFPELVNLRSDLVTIPEASPEQARSLLFEALRQLFLILSQNQRLLLILDDGQWADTASLDAMMYLLGRAPFEKHALLIIAARPEIPNSRLEQCRAVLKSYSDATILNLPKMDLDEVDYLSRQVLGQSVLPDFVERLAHETGGNPFFILETLHALIREQPTLELEKLNALPLPESVTRLVQERLNFLSPQARSILDMAALVGSEFSPRTLVQVSKLDSSSIALALDELTERQLLIKVDQPNQAPRYRFTHDMFREVTLLQINPLRAQVIHREIAFALLEEDSARSSQSAILADHFEAAEEWCLAFQHWLSAGQHARQLFAISEAYQAYQNAERLIDRCSTSLNDRQIYALYKDWGELAYSCNDSDTLQAMNANLMKLGNRLQSPLLKGTALVRLGNACFSTGQLEEGLLYTQMAVELLSNTDNIYQLTNARTHLGVFYYMTGHVVEAIQIFESALQEIEGKEAENKTFLRACLNYEIGMCMILNGQPRQGIEYGLQSLKDHTTLRNLDGMVTAYTELTLASYFLGQYSQGFHYGQLGIQDAGQSQSLRMLGYLYDYLAMLELATGNLDAMLEYAEKAIELGRRIGQADIYVAAFRLISDTFYLMENFEKSLEFLELAHIQNLKSFVALDTLYRLKSVHFILNQDPAIIVELKQIIQQAEESGLITGKLLAQISLMMAYRTLQEWEKAHSLAQEIKEASQSRGFRSFVIAANLVLAHCQWQAGNQANAFRFLNESIQEAESLPFVWLEMMGRILLHRFYQQTGQAQRKNTQRIQHLLEILNNRCQKSFFQPDLQAYTQRIEHRLA